MNAQKALGVLNAALDLILSGALSEEGIVDVSGTFVATLVVEGTADGTTYRALAMSPVGGGADVTSVSAAGAWRINFAGCKGARVRVSAYTSGSAVVAAQVMKKAA